MTRKQSSSASSPTTSRSGRRWRRLIILVFVVIVGYTLFGFFGVPLLIRHVAVPRLADRLNGDATLTRAAFNPYTLCLVLEGFEVVDEQGATVTAFKRFEGNLQLLATVFRKGYHFRTARLTEPLVHAEIMPDGVLNVRRLIKTAEPSGDPSADEPLREIPRLVVADVAITDGKIAFFDRSLSEVFQAEVDGLNFTINSLDTQPDFENLYELVAQTDEGAELRWTGSFHVDPLSSRGTVALRDAALPRFMPYARRFTDGRLTQGRLSIEFDYDFAPTRVPRVAKTTVRTLTLDDLAVELDEEEIVGLPLVSIRNAALDADARSATVELVTVAQPRITLERNEAGELAILRLLASSVMEQADAMSPTGPESAAPTAPRIDPRNSEYPLRKLAAAVAQLIEDTVGTWSLDVQRAVIEDGTVSVSDRAVREPMSMELTAIELETGRFSSDEGFRVPVVLRLTVAGTGTITMEGETSVRDRSADLEVTANEVPLVPVSPYLPEELPEPLPPIRLADARLSAEGQLHAALGESDTLDSTWSGEVRVDELRFDDPTGGAAVLSLGRLQLKGDASTTIEADGQQIGWTGTTEFVRLEVDAPLAGPVHSVIDRLAVNGALSAQMTREGAPEATFRGDVEIAGLALEAPEQKNATVTLGRALATGIDFDERSKHLTLAELSLEEPNVRAELPLLPAESAEASAASPAESAETTRISTLPYQVVLNHVRLNRGTIEIADPLTDPPATVLIEELEAEASGISTDGQTVADVNATSRLQNTGRLRFEGKVDAFRERPYADVTLAVKTLPLKPFDPFAGRYVGYLVETGRLNLTVPVTVEEGMVNGVLDVNFDQLHLGDSVESPDAPSVPVKLGLDLLRDRDDQITTELSFSGDLTDPTFSFGGIIWQAFLNLLLKAATSPFDLLGVAFGGGADQDLSAVQFEAGTADLNADALATLDVLGRALSARPALSLEIHGEFDRSADGAALQRAQLRQQLAGQIGVADPATLSDAQYEEAVRQAYAAQRTDPSAPPTEISFEQMEALLLEPFPVADEALIELARQRAEKVAAVILQDQGVPSERVTVAAPEAADAEGEGPRARFTLG